MQTLRFIDDVPAAGPWNMAADELLLEQAQTGQATLRLYRWEPSTLSLGYFQPAQERLLRADWQELPWLRRSTGGGAILHDADEITYALALPPAVARQRTHVEWHEGLHALMVAELRVGGLAAELLRGSRPKPKELGFLCFAVPQPGDVLLAGKKIIGGAQRLRGGALLQHGSITPPAAAFLQGRLAAAVARELGLTLASAAWSAAEGERIGQLAEKYRSPSWNLKR